MNDYMKLASEAAELEREQCFYQAVEAWERARLASHREQNRIWCALRAEFCRKARRWVERGIERAA